MKFSLPLVHGFFIERHKRFLSDIRLDDGTIVQAHCPNSGSLKSCLVKDADVYLSPVNDSARRTKFTWEMILIDGNWVGIHTNYANNLAIEILQNRLIPELSMYDTFRPEVKFLDSRFDVLAHNKEQQCFIEVKNVTLKEGDYGMFPDAVTTRGQKHLETLIKVKESGHHAAMLYIVQRIDVNAFKPAHHIDPEYGKKLLKAVEAGVEVYAYQILVTPEALTPLKMLPIQLK